MSATAPLATDTGDATSADAPVPALSDTVQAPDDDADAAEPVADADAAPDTDVQPAAKAGCVGRSVCESVGLKCLAATGKCVACLAKADCPTGAACQANQCVASQPCKPGAVVCDSLGAVAACQLDGTFKVKPCPTGAVCFGGVCAAKVCTPGAESCQGSFTATCAGNGTLWQALEDCSQLGEKFKCVGGQCKEGVCTPGSVTCVGDAMCFCGASGQCADKLSCAMLYGPGATCIGGKCGKSPCAAGVSKACDGKKVVSCAGSTATVEEDCAQKAMVCSKGACIQPVCVPYDSQCDGDKVVECLPDGSAWDVYDDCAVYGEVCIDGWCEALPCQPGGVGCQGGKAVQCVGRQVQVLDDCPQKGLVCNKGACAKPVCQPFDSKCEGNTVVACEMDGSAWTPDIDCDLLGQTCIDGKCTKSPCKPGQLGCKDYTAVQCDATGAVTVVEECLPKAQLCESGMCVTPTCFPGDLACDGTWATKCDTAGKLWIKKKDCSLTGATCMEGYCVDKICAAGDKGCYGPTQALCAADGKGWQEQACAAGSVCQQGACMTPKCTLGKLAGEAVRLATLTPLKPSDACDLDGDGVPENEAGSLAVLAFQGVYEVPGAKPLRMALQADAWKGDGTPFDLRLVAGHAAPGTQCDTLNATMACKLQLDPGCFDLQSSAPQCPAKSLVPGAKVAAGALSAGGGNTTVQLPNVMSPLVQWGPVSHVQILGTVNPAAPGKGITKGRFCGAVTMADLMKSLDATPAWLYQSIGTSLAEYKQFVQMWLTPDLDLDGDGNADHVSFGFAFTGTPVEFVP